MASMVPDNIDKAALRREAALRRRRAALDGRDLRALFLAALADLPTPVGGVAAGYWPMRDEVDVVPLLMALAKRGMQTCLPVVERRDAPLQFRRWVPGDALDDGPHGTRNPVPQAEAITPHMLFVPLLAFDQAGGRLGYGGGYYDRTLEALRRDNPAVQAVGVAYQAQEWPGLPIEDHDQPLNWLLTETGLKECVR